MYSEKHVGNTPLVQINRIAAPQGARVVVKLETHNLGGSIKARPALQMLLDCESAGILIPGTRQTIIAATGGNLGSALACLTLTRGYRVILVIPNNFSPVKIRTCESYGAEVFLSDHKLGRDSHVRKTAELIADNPSYINLNQFTSPANPRSHYLHTGREILDSLGNRVDVFTACVGSGGTLSGIGKRIREKNRRTRIVAVQPQGCDILNGRAIDHIVEGTTLGFVPATFDVHIVDDVIEVTKEEVLQTFRRLPLEEGIFVGLSSAANICAAVKIASKLPKDCIVSTVAPDSGRNYVS
jgi:cysteine synthase A